MPETKLADVSVEDINSTYKAGYITAQQKNDLMRRKAEQSLHDYIADKGILRAYFHQTVKHVQEQWNEFVQMVDDYKPAQAGTKQANTVGAAANEALQRIQIAGKVMWNEIQVLSAPFTAFSEVNETVAKQWALDAGASPGLAKGIGIAVGVGSNFVPIGKVSQAMVKGIQAPEVAKVVSKVTGAVDKVNVTSTAATAAKAGKAASKIADDALMAALKEDGAKVAKEILPEAAPAKAVEIPDFYKALRQYHGEIKNVTETKHLADIEKEADKLGMHLDDLKALGKDTPLTPAQIKAYLKTLDEPTNNLVNTARGVINNEPEAASLFDKQLIEYFGLGPKFRAAEVEAGRTVKVLDADPRMKSITEMMAAWHPEEMAKLQPDVARKLMAEDFLAMAENTDKLKNLQIQVASGNIPKGPTFWSQLREVYTNLLLARPVTQVRNFLGNAFAATNSALEREIGGWFSIDKAKGIVKGDAQARPQRAHCAARAIF